MLMAKRRDKQNLKVKEKAKKSGVFKYEAEVAGYFKMWMLFRGGAKGGNKD